MELKIQEKTAPISIGSKTAEKIVIRA